MLRDEEFSTRAKVDRYGRKLPKGAGKKELEKYYKIADEDVESEEGEGDENDDDAIERELRRVNAKDEVTSSSDSSSSDEESLDEEEQEEVFGMLEDNGGHGEGIPEGEVSSRLAVVNLDWDNIRAADLMAVFSSFVPSHGRIVKIAIYPSEFGRERMGREEKEGPPKEIFESKRRAGQQKDDRDSIEEDQRGNDENEEEEEVDDNNDEQIKKSILKEDQGQEYNSAKLRRYQLERLRYYYAVLTCSSNSVAQAMYDTVDGTEYLTTANFFDLRYIPDETDFSEDRPRDECERIPDGYRPNEFVTDALQHSKVRLTWDADDGTRKEAQKRAFVGSRADIDENDLKAYLGSDSSEDEGPKPIIVDATSDIPGAAIEAAPISQPTPKLSKNEAERQRMRGLLGLQSEPGPKKSKAEKEAPVGDMQVTFSSLTSGPKGTSVFENTPEQAQETTLERYVRKEKERKARRKLKSKDTGQDGSTMTDPINEIAQDAAVEPESTQLNLGFSDSFFADPSSTSSQTPSSLKAAKRLKRTQRAAEEAATAAKRAELELLMLDDDKPNHPTTEDGTGKVMKHFDMPSLLRAEKAMGKARGKRKLSERDRLAIEAKAADNFKLDTGDARFRDLYEKAEFAIDPTHPRFVRTEGMRELVGKRRRMSGRDDGGVEIDEVDSMEGKRREKKIRREGKGKGKGKEEAEEVRRLVQRVKKRGKEGT